MVLFHQIYGIIIPKNGIIKLNSDGIILPNYGAIIPKKWYYKTK